PVRRVLAATAGDADSRGALRIAAELARTRGASVCALAVASPFRHGSSLITVEGIGPFDETNRRDILRRLIRRTRATPGADTWMRRAITGWPSEQIVQMAEEWNASLIVLGLCRHSAIDRLFGGKTANAVAHRAHHPVLAVTPRTRSLPGHALVGVDFTLES